MGKGILAHSKMLFVAVAIDIGPARGEDIDAGQLCPLGIEVEGLLNDEGCTAFQVAQDATLAISLKA